MKVAILGGARIPFARANGAYNEASNQDMLTAALKALVDRFALKGEKLGEVAAGAVIKHSRDWNLARESTLGSGLHPTTPAYDLQPGRSRGKPGEEMAREWQTGRKEQDELALASHKNAAAAWLSGFFADLVVEYQDLKRDNNVRADTSLEKLASLRTAFDPSPAGTLTAGNSSPLTDGAASVLLASEDWARSRGIPVQAYLTFSETAAVDFVGMAGPKEGMLMAPAYAVPRMLDRAKLKLQDFDIYEIHEAFAAQVLCTLKAWESENYCRNRLGRDAPLGSIDRAKLNPKGSSVALGHPFAATGARIVATLAKQLAERGSGRGLISICAAGGMGVTAILER